MGKTFFITLTGFKNYYDRKPFEPGLVVKLVKEPDNPYDAEAISVELPFIGRVAYVANSTNTVARGTSSAGRIHGLFRRETFAQVLFMTHASIICMVLPPEKKAHPAEGDKPASESGSADITPARRPGKPRLRPGFIRQDADGLYMDL